MNDRAGKWLLLAALVALLWRVKVSDAQLAVARTLYGEARGEGQAGMEAVASVIMNRAAAGGWWGDTPLKVVFQPWQFSTWNANDPNRNLIEDKSPGQGDATFDLAYEVAGRALAGDLPDRTGGATHYHVDGIFPAWAETGVLSAVVGAHRFYTDVA